MAPKWHRTLPGSFLVRPGAGERRFGYGCRPIVGVVEQVRVNTQCDRWRSMPEATAHRQDINADGDQSRGVRVPQGMQRHLRTARSPHDDRPFFGQRIGRTRLALPSREHKIRREARPKPRDIRCSCCARQCVRSSAPAGRGEGDQTPPGG